MSISSIYGFLALVGDVINTDISKLKSRANEFYCEHVVFEVSVRCLVRYNYQTTLNVLPELCSPYLLIQQHEYLHE